MLLVGMVCGIGIGLGIAAILGDKSKIGLELKRLEREIAAYELECAKEERRTAALCAIAENERQAMDKEIDE